MVKKTISRIVMALFVFLTACSGPTESVEPDDVVNLLVPWKDVESDFRVSEELHIRTEQIIADCMNEAGFEYVPVGFSSVVFGPGFGITRSEYARQFGFGISTNDQTLAAANQQSNRTNDPNQSFLGSLSSERRVAWGDSYDRCEQESREEAPQLTQDFRVAVGSLVDRVKAESSVVEAETTWAECITEAIQIGLPTFGTLDDLVSWFQTESERLQALPEQLADLQDLERRVAVQHLECEPPLIDAMRDAARKFEPELVAQFEEEIESQIEFLGG